MAGKIWYCGRCQRVLRADEEIALDRGCECETPVLEPPVRLLNEASPNRRRKEAQP